MNPDNKEAEAKNLKKRMQAYEILSDPEKKSRYDRFGHAGSRSSSREVFEEGFGGFGDIFEDIFDIFGGGGFSRAQEEQDQLGVNDLRYDLNLDFKRDPYLESRERNTN